jgi:hypothetical protein
MPMTFIYFILDPHQNAVKIGRTDQPLIRLAQLRDEYGYQLSPLLWLIKPGTFESELHKRFGADQLYKYQEWYNYSDSIREFIVDQLPAISEPEYCHLPRLILEENRHRIALELGKLHAVLERISQSKALRSRHHPSLEMAVAILEREVRRFEDEFIIAQTQLKAQQTGIERLKSEPTEHLKSQR